jgi:hypothetical protein
MIEADPSFQQPGWLDDCGQGSVDEWMGNLCGSVRSELAPALVSRGALSPSDIRFDAGDSPAGTGGRKGNNSVTERFLRQSGGGYTVIMCSQETVKRN